MAHSQKHRRNTVADGQREHLLQSMDKIIKTNEHKRDKLIWHQLTMELNQLGEPKDTSKWRKFWTDLLLRLRKKIQHIKKKFDIESLGDKRLLKIIKESSPEDMKVINIYGGIEDLFFETEKKTPYNRKNKIETISIDDSDDDDDNYEHVSTSGYEYNHTYSHHNENDINIKKYDNTIDEMIPMEINPEIIENDMIDYLQKDTSNESLEIQKQTLIEIQRLGAAQQETNELLKILINRLTNSTSTTTTNSNSSLPNLVVDSDGSTGNNVNRIASNVVKKENMN